MAKHWAAPCRGKRQARSPGLPETLQKTWWATTFDTGFGIGVVVNNQLNRGDNSCIETFCLKHKKMPDIIVEDGVAVRAIKRVYGEVSGDVKHAFEPRTSARSPTANVPAMSKRPNRPSPSWARSPATPWQRP